MPTLTAAITARELNRQAASGSPQLIDVRSPTEFAAGHIPRAVNLPLDQLEGRLADLDPSVPVVIACQSGRRAALASEWLTARGFDCTVVEQGTSAWYAAGFPLVSCTRTRWSLERQVRLGAGLLVLSGFLLTLLVSPYGIWLCGLIGLGLTFAGITDVCLLAKLLAAMPWNGARAVPPGARVK